MVSIGLCMIMKNEEKVLLRVLNSIYPILDYYTVVDTGSTDRSKQIVKDFFDSKGIPGEIHDHAWVNFSDARNHALDKLKASGKANYGMIIDCDEQLKLSPQFNIPAFKDQISGYDIVSVAVNQPNAKFSRRCFFKTSRPFKWERKVHNMLGCTEPIKELFTGDEIQIMVNMDGNTWTKQGQKEKYLAHAKILEKEVAEKNSPRDVFYLAQSYRDAFESEKAIEWYKKRLAMNNGFYEELYYSQLMIAGLKWQLNYSIQEVADEYMKCGELDTLRCEHLYFLKTMYEKNGRPRSAAKVGELLIKYKNPYPERKLFINPAAYPRT